jgi:hypothetical protein
MREPNEVKLFIGRQEPDEMKSRTRAAEAWKKSDEWEGEVKVDRARGQPSLLRVSEGKDGQRILNVLGPSRGSLDMAANCEGWEPREKMSAVTIFCFISSSRAGDGEV